MAIRQGSAVPCLTNDYASKLMIHCVYVCVMVAGVIGSEKKKTSGTQDWGSNKTTSGKKADDDDGFGAFTEARKQTSSAPAAAPAADPFGSFTPSKATEPAADDFGSFTASTTPGSGMRAVGFLMGKWCGVGAACEGGGSGASNSFVYLVCVCVR